MFYCTECGIALEEHFEQCPNCGGEVAYVK